MRGKNIARRYGKALFDLARELGVLDDVAADLEKFSQVIKEIPNFMKGLTDERVEVNRRIAAAKKISENLETGKTVSNLLNLMIAKGRINLLPLVMGDFISRLDRHKDLAVTWAVVSDSKFVKDLKNEIEDILKRTLDRKAICNVSVDPSLIGGFVVRLGDVRYESSVRGKLIKMKEEMISKI